MQIIEITLKIITNDIFIGYGLFSIVLIILTLFLKNNEFLNKLDISASRVISYSGIAYFVLWIAGILLAIDKTDSGPDSAHLFNRMSGPYRPYFWLQPALWILMTQLLWIEKVRRLKVVRLVFSVLFIISFERYVILVTSLHRDYVPAGWTVNISYTDIVFGLSVKTAFFGLVALAHQVVNEKIKALYTMKK